MSLAITAYDSNSGAVRISPPIASASITTSVGDVVVVMFAVEDNDSAGSLSISNSGTALSWNLVAQTNSYDNCKMSVWWARANESEIRTISVSWDSGLNRAVMLSCRVISGADQTTPVPAGNIFAGVSATDVSQSITPSKVGSAIFMIVADWAATNSYVARSGCAVSNVHHLDGCYTGAIVSPTTNPLVDSNPISLGETDTGGRITWIAFEVQPADAAASGLDQEGFRIRNDDGSETSATWLAAQDVNSNIATNGSARIRFLVDATDNPTGKQYQLEYRHQPAGGAFGSWGKVN